MSFLENNYFEPLTIKKSYKSKTVNFHWECRQKVSGNGEKPTQKFVNHKKCHQNFVPNAW